MAPSRCEAVTVMLLRRDHRLGHWTGVLGTPLDVFSGIPTIQSSQVLALQADITRESGRTPCSRKNHDRQWKLWRIFPVVPLGRKRLSKIGKCPMQMQKPASERKRAFCCLDNCLNVGLEGC